MKKIHVIAGIDPYVIESQKFDCNTEKFPAITHPDFGNYIIFGMTDNQIIN